MSSHTPWCAVVKKPVASTKRLIDTLVGRRVLVLGGTGRIGKIVMADFPRDLFSELKILNSDDVSLPDGVSDLARDWDIVINLAAVARPSNAGKDPIKALQTNFVTVFRLIDHFRDTNCKLLLVSSIRTVAVNSVYAWTKIVAEAIVAAETKGLHVTAVRLGNVLETADSLIGLIKSISSTSSSEAFVVGGCDYYQPSSQLLKIFALALNRPAGSLVTPLLGQTPVPFLAGYLAASLHTVQGGSLDTWNPRYSPAEPIQPLIPPWWIPFTRLDKVHEGENSLYCLVTNFSEKPNNERRSQALRDAIERETQPHFGSIAAHLDAAVRRFVG